MADNVTVDNGALTDYTVSADEGAGGQVQRVKLAYSADGSETHVTADADGLLVNLGANNDVTVTGTVTVGSHAVTNAGTFAVQESGSALTALQLIDNLVLAEDAAHASADPGVQMLAVRKAAPANVSGTDGDYEPLQVSAGRLWASATVDAALPAGTNNIGDVDVLTVPAPLSTTGGGTEAAALRVTLASDSTGLVSVDDNGGSLTVDGTVAATQSGTWNVTNVSGTVSLPTGASTLAEQQAQTTALQLIDDVVFAEDAAHTTADKGVQVLTVRKDTAAATSGTDGDYQPPITDGSGRLWVNASGAAVPVTDNSGSLTVDNGGTFAVQESGGALTALQVIDDWDESDRAKVNPIVGQAGIAAGAGAVGVTVPRVTLASDDPAVALLATIDADTGGTVTHAATIAGAIVTSDAVASASATGIPAQFIRDDTLATLGVADGDWTPGRVDANGAAWVQLAGALSSSVDSIAAVGTIAHDAASTANPLMAGGYASAAAPTSVSADGDAVRAWYLRNGAAATVLTAAGALVGGDATNGLDVDVTRVPAPLSTTGGGTEATALRVTVATDSTGVLSVDDNGGSLTIDGTVTASNAAGDIAHDAADSGNPVKVGAKAANALPTAVANNDRANAIADLFGRLLTSHIDPAMQVTKATNVTTTQTGSTVWDPTSGKKIAVTSVVIGSYGTADAARVILWFGDNADTTYTAGTDQVLLAASFAPSATAKPGLVFTPAVPIFCTTADRELHLTTDAAIDLDITVHGYEW